MKALLNAIKTQLQTDLTYVRDGDVFITPHEDFLPHDVKFPAVGIKDGSIIRAERMGGCMEYEISVSLIPWVAMAKPEASIMGDSATSRKGVLDVADDIHTALDENLLAISGMQEAFSPSESGSETLGSDTRLLQKKNITYVYRKEGNRP